MQKIHIKAKKNWINDPNGMIYYNGLYHIFCQYFPYEPIWGTMHWRHFTSKDLVTWEDHGIALYPSCEADRNGCFSGSAIEHEGKMHLFYTGVYYTACNPAYIHNAGKGGSTCSNQMHITSEDGFTFRNRSEKQCIIPHLPEQQYGTCPRDPKVWCGKDAWYMVLGSDCPENGNGILLFYRSTDLETWEQVNTYSRPDYGRVWECPDLFQVDGQYFLSTSPMDLLPPEEKTRAHAVCIPVDFEEKTCSVRFTGDWVYSDLGKDLYAAQTTLDEYGNRIMVGWLRMAEKDGWNGMLSTPRVVEYRNGHLYFRIHPNIKAAFTEKTDRIDGQHIFFEADLSEGQAIDLGGYRITVQNGKVRADRTQVHRKGVNAEPISETPVLSGNAHIEVILDPDYIEIFVNGGEYVISHVLYQRGNAFRSDVPLTLYTVKA